MPDLPAPVGIGTIVAGKYRIERILGSGGMGVVVAATHVQIERPVALKFLQRDAASNPEVLSRFLREARAVGRIQSEHVTQVLDVGTLDTGEPYLVMEYLDGDDLARVLARRGPLPIAEAVDYVLEACEAVAEAHALGIVHRDLKPANLFLVTRPSGQRLIKVLDFGISKTKIGPHAESLTTTASLVGTPVYMSPEHMLSSRAADERSDVWSMGIVLYELLSGGRPFSAETMPALVLAVTRGNPRPLREQRGEIPPALESAVLKCLEKRPEDRFAGMAQLAAAIAPHGSPRGREIAERISNVRPGLVRSDSSWSVDPDAPTTPAGTSAAAATPPRTRVGSRAVFAGVVAFFAVALAAFFAGWLAPANRSRGETPLSSASVAPTAVEALDPVAPPTAPSSSSPPAPSASAPASASPSAAPAPSDKPRAAVRPPATNEPRPSVPRMDLK